MNVHLIESHEQNGVEWGISFTDNNLEVKDFFAMDKETAIRLHKYLSTPSLSEVDINKMAEECVKYLGWEGTGDANDIKKAFIAGYTAKQI